MTITVECFTDPRYSRPRYRLRYSDGYTRGSFKLKRHAQYVADIENSRSPHRRCKQMNLTPEETATILAALRFYQSYGVNDDTATDGDIYDIATEGGTLTPLGSDDIDALCDEIIGA